MNDELSIADRKLGEQIMNLTLQHTVRRDPSDVVERALASRREGWRRSWWRRAPAAALAAVVVLAVSVGAFGVLMTQQESSGLASARVDGLDYTVAVARSFDISADALTPYADRASIDPLFEFDGLVAYSVPGTDPTQILVMKLAPDQRDDAGPLGSYVLLVRGPDSFGLVCAYFDPLSEATPRACRKN